MQGLIQDLRFGIRMLLKNRTVSAVAIMALAVGIGANTAIFSWVDAVLLKSLPVRKPEELVLFRWSSASKLMARSVKGPPEYDQNGLRTSDTFSYLAFQRMHTQQSSFGDLFAFAPLEQLNVNIVGEPEISDGQLVSGDYFNGLGVQTVAGRPITAGDDQITASPVAVLSYNYWQRRFSLSPDVLGQTIKINNTAFTIIGVTPPQFHGALDIGSDPAISIPLAQEPLVRAGGPKQSTLDAPWYWWLHVMGRLKPGVTADQVGAGLQGIYQQSAIDGWAASGESGQQDLPHLKIAKGSQGLTELRKAYAQPLRILMIVVGLSLLIACANVANLLLARAVARQKEMALRQSLGAGRMRLIRQLLTESMLLAITGGGLGLLLAYWGKDLLLAWQLIGANELALDLKLDWRVLVFTAAISLTTGILFGLAPAFRATRIRLTPALKEEASSAGAKARLNNVLIVGQVALSLVLLVGAGLFLRTLRNLQRVAVGFNRENLLLFRVDPGLNNYQAAQISNLYRQMTEHIAVLPGVRDVTYSRFALLSGDWADSPFNVLGQQEQSYGDQGVHVLRIGPNYFRTIEAPLLRGRPLNEHDNAQSARVAVINQSLAQRFFPHQDPVGRRFFFGALVPPSTLPDPTRVIEIVGVVADTKYRSLRQAAPPTVYTSAEQTVGGPGQMAFAVRTVSDPLAFVPAVRAAVRELDPNLPLFGFTTEERTSEESIQQERLFARLTACFGLLALVLVSIGLYGVMSYSVTRRTREMGIRMALGAQRRNILRLVLENGLKVALAGVAIGLFAAFGLTRFVGRMLYGVAPTDPLTFVLIALLLLLVALLACYLPARRATKVDPIVALRYE